MRLRIVNAGSDTAFRVALGAHRLTITHTDGFPVQPAEADALLVGMGERFDVLVTLRDGVFPLVAIRGGQAGHGNGRGADRSRTPPSASVRPVELDGQVVTATASSRRLMLDWQTGRPTAGTTSC